MPKAEEAVADWGPTPNGSTSRIGTIVGYLQAFYGFCLFSVSLLTIAVLLLGGPSHYAIDRWLSILLCLGNFSLMYWGLRLRKPWVVHLLVAGSASHSSSHCSCRDPKRPPRLH